ncbi:MAG: DEAD/DEAH box helicase [Clostridia bacterium]
MLAVQSDNEIKIYDGYLFKESVKEIDGRYYDGLDKAWCVPLTEKNVALLSMLGAELDEELKKYLVASKSDCEAEAPIEPMPIKATPYKHQIKGFNFALQALGKGKAVAYLMDMGAGKTITTIAVVGRLFNQGKIRKLLVVAPKTIVGVWEEEYLKFADYNYHLAILDGNSDKKIETIQNMFGLALQIIVVNYESCWRLENELATWQPDMIVCDESSKIKNAQAKQSKALHRLGKKSKYNVILTGTPIVNSPLDFFSQYKFLDENIFGGSFYSFRAKHAILGGYMQRQIVGYRSMAEMLTKAHEIAYRIKIEDAVDLPPFIDETRAINLESRAKAIYDSIDKDSYAELMSGEITTRNVLTRLLRLSQCTGGYIRNDTDSVVQEVSRAKIEALEDIVDTCLNEDKKVVVFARFVPEIEAIEKMLKSKQIGYSLIMGSVKDRAEQVTKFQIDPNVKVFVGQLQTTGMGITLTAASLAVFYSLDFNYANYEQSRARIHRIGQSKKTLYIHLVAKGTVDEKIMQALKHKGDIAKLMVDDYKKLLN